MQHFQNFPFHYYIKSSKLQWNSSCEATPLHKKHGLSREVIKSVHLSLDLYCQVIFLAGWPLIRGTSQKAFYCIIMLLTLN